MRRIGIVAALAASLVVGVLARAPAAWACTCSPATVAEQVRDADVVFVGTVAAANDAAPGETGRATLTLEEIVKGRLPRAVDVRTEGDTCGVSFTEGHRYLVFAAARDGSLSTDACMGSGDDVAGRIEEARRAAATGNDRSTTVVKPFSGQATLAGAERAEPRSRTGPIAAAALIAAAAVLGLLALWRRATRA